METSGALVFVPRSVVPAVPSFWCMQPSECSHGDAALRTCSGRCCGKISNCALQQESGYVRVFAGKVSFKPSYAGHGRAGRATPQCPTTTKPSSPSTTHGASCSVTASESSSLPSVWIVLMGSSAMRENTADATLDKCFLQHRRRNWRNS